MQAGLVTESSKPCPSRRQNFTARTASCNTYSARSRCASAYNVHITLWCGLTSSSNGGIMLSASCLLMWPWRNKEKLETRLW